MSLILIVFPDLSLRLGDLEEFDISHNSFTKCEITSFLSWLNPERIKRLNISNMSAADEGFITELDRFLQRCQANSLNLCELNLARCSVSDTEVYELLQYVIILIGTQVLPLSVPYVISRTLIQKCPEFEVINLSYNPLLSAISLRRLLQCTSIKRLHLYGCESITKYFNEESFFTSSEESQPRLELLQLSVDPVDHAAERNTLFRMWKQRFPGISKTVELDGFLELSVTH